MQTLQIALFAKLDIRRGGMATAKLPAKAEELLCYLLLRPGQPHTREALACELWADAPARQSKKYLRQCLWQLQQALELPAISRPLLRLEHEWVAVHPDAQVQLDVAQFERAFATVRDRLGAALDPQQVQAAQKAAALYQGDLLIGWYQNWCLVERALRVDVLHIARQADRLLLRPAPVRSGDRLWHAAAARRLHPRAHPPPADAAVCACRRPQHGAAPVRAVRRGASASSVSRRPSRHWRWWSRSAPASSGTRRPSLSSYAPRTRFRNPSRRCWPSWRACVARSHSSGTSLRSSNPRRGENQDPFHNHEGAEEPLGDARICKMWIFLSYQCVFAMMTEI